MYSRICSYNLYLPADCLPDVIEKAKGNIKIVKLLKLYTITIRKKKIRSRMYLRYVVADPWPGFSCQEKDKTLSRSVTAIYEKGTKKSDGLFCVWYNF